MRARLVVASNPPRDRPHRANRRIAIHAHLRPRGCARIRGLVVPVVDVYLRVGVDGYYAPAKVAVFSSNGMCSDGVADDAGADDDDEIGYAGGEAAGMRRRWKSR